MTGHTITPEAAASLDAYRRRKDAARADVIDTRFFNMNPDRVFHIRASLPTERKPTSADAPENTSCIMFLDRRTKVLRRIWCPIDIAALPDEEKFLARLWARVEGARLSGDDIVIKPDEHRRWLIETGKFGGVIHG